jgi:acyl carrier protein
MMERDAVVRRLTTIFQETFEDDGIELHDAMTAADLDDWDSLQHIVLVLAIEREFALKLNPAEVGKLANVGKMVDLLCARAGANV